MFYGGEYSSLYFYSALFQWNAALVALIAMFLVFRRQYLDDRFHKLENIIIEYLKKTAGVTALYSNIYDFETYKEEMEQKLDEAKKTGLKKVMKDKSWADRFKELRGIDNTRNVMWRDARFPISGLFALLILQIALGEIGLFGLEMP